MPDFRCRLAAPSGEIVSRDYTALDAADLRNELERQDFLVLEMQRRSAVLSAFSDLFRRRKKLNMNEFLYFNQEFAALVRAGLPIVECLGMLCERRKNPDFRAALENVRERVRSGDSLSDAFGAHAMFPPLYASTLASGERSGEIANVLTRYVSYMKIILNVRGKVRAALTYPAILVTMAIGLVILLLTYVLPKFEGLFHDFGAELPLVTRIVIGVSATLRGHWLLVLAGVVTLVAGTMIWRRTPMGRRMIERAVYRLPIVGSIAHKFVVTRFARTLSTLIAGGIPLVNCLEIVSQAVGVGIFRDAISGVALKIREGAALWSATEETGLFPDILVEMVKVGESSGSLPEMLEHVADFTDQEIERDLQTMVSLIEPIVLVAMALIIGFLLLAIYYPLLMVYANAQI
ncbi:MAG: type II secretion system F family protein [Acidobacteriota bacterium]|nr:type II secretion system F family protein [Acidobacteriota bacterium]